MLNNNVYTVLRFPPLHINKKFKKYCCGSFENSQNLYENGINLPIHNNLDDNDLDKVINLVKKWCKN
jgi:dTDP-4-amino-4,6-dideoxygalactose transaminase